MSSFDSIELDRTEEDLGVRMHPQAETGEC